MNHLNNPLGIAAIIGIIFAFVTGFFIIRYKSKKLRIPLAFLILLLLTPSVLAIYAYYPWLVDSRHRTYRAFYNDIEIGMTRDQVMELAEKHYPKGGQREFPIVLNEETSEFGFFMNPEDSREPNCEGIFLQLDDGKVTRVSYSAD